jgi:hypothetical protein
MTSRERQLHRDAAYIEKQAKARIAELRRKGVENLSEAEVSELRDLDNRAGTVARPFQFRPAAQVICEKRQG